MKLTNSKITVHVNLPSELAEPLKRTPRMSGSKPQITPLLDSRLATMTEEKRQHKDHQPLCSWRDSWGGPVSTGSICAEPPADLSNSS